MSPFLHAKSNVRNKLDDQNQCHTNLSLEAFLPPHRVFRFFNIPFKMRADPFEMIGVIGSLQQQRFITAVSKVRHFLLT